MQDTRSKQWLTLLDLLKKTEVTLEFIGTNLEAEWKKVFLNAVLNPCVSLLNSPNGEMVSNDYLKALFPLLTTEVRKVAASEEIDLEKVNDEQLTGIISNSAENFNSHLVDLMNKQRSEIDFTLGAVVKKAYQNKIEVPHLATLLLLYKAMQLKRLR